MNEITIQQKEEFLNQVVDLAIQQLSNIKVNKLSSVAAELDFFKNEIIKDLKVKDNHKKKT